MFHHPDQLMSLNRSHLHELKTENDRWHLATKVMRAQQPAPKRQLRPLSVLRTRLSQFFSKLAHPTWETAVKPG